MFTSRFVQQTNEKVHPTLCTLSPLEDYQSSLNPLLSGFLLNFSSLDLCKCNSEWVFFGADEDCL